MVALDGTEIWRTIPPEEKLELMSQAHAKGIFAALVGIMLGGTLAVALHQGWLLWASLISSPFIFQFAAGKAWRGLRPRLVLEYLAARSAARRYAFSNKGKDLTLNLMFRGKLSQVFDEENLQEALEAVFENTSEAAVWVALFGDSVVMMSEDVGGARLQLAQVLNDKISIDSRPADSGRDYANDKELLITIRTKREEERRYKLTSKHPAALIVFEKKARQQLETLKKGGAEADAEISELGDSMDSDMEIPQLDEY